MLVATDMKQELVQLLKSLCGQLMFDQYVGHQGMKCYFTVVFNSVVLNSVPDIFTLVVL